MVSSEEFYELSQEKRQKLVAQRRVICDQDPVREVPEYGAPIRILDKPLTTIIFDRLQKSRYTVSDLAEEIGVRDKHVRIVINQHRHRRFEKLLNEYNAVLRAKDIRGPAFVYSIESIPYFTRVLDPTLGCSLLGWNNELLERFEATEWFPAGKVTKVDEDYAWAITNYWELDFDHTFDYITEFERRYVETTFGPLPVLEDAEEYENVRSRLAEAENAYTRRKGIDETTPREKVNVFADKHAKGAESMTFYQSLSLTLFDLLEYAQHEEASIRDPIKEQLDVVLEWVGPSPDMQDAAPTQPDPENTNGERPEPSESQSSASGEEGEFDWDERELLIELVALTQELGRLPSETDINDRTQFSHRAYREKFGSLMEAFKKAGILPEEASDSEDGSSHTENEVTEETKNQIENAAEILELSSRTKETAEEYYQIATDADRCTFSDARDADQWAAAAAVVAAEMENGEIEKDSFKQIATLGDVTRGQLKTRCWNLKRAVKEVEDG